MRRRQHDRLSLDEPKALDEDGAVGFVQRERLRHTRRRGLASKPDHLVSTRAPFETMSS
jgi:hypothetical protein